jgi:hypothetical protein
MAAAEAKAQMNPIIAERQTFLATNRFRRERTAFGQSALNFRSSSQRSSHSPWIDDVTPQSLHNIGNDAGVERSGKALSMTSISAAVSRTSPAAAFSTAWVALEALGMAKSEGWRVRKANATWRGVAPCAAATFARTLPPALRRPGKRRCPKGL